MKTALLRSLPSEAEIRLSSSVKLKQISSLVGRTRSLFPVVAEEATSHAARNWSVRKTQLLLTRLRPSSLLFFSPSTVLPEIQLATPLPPALTAEGIAQSEFVQKGLAHRS